LGDPAGGEHKVGYLSGYPRPIPNHPDIIFPEEKIRFTDKEEGEEFLHGVRPALPAVRIGGGEDVNEEEGGGVPWQVSIQSVGESESELCGVKVNRSSHICGGSILDERTVLSAAHCFLSSLVDL